MNSFEALLKIEPNLSYFEEAEVEFAGKSVGWHISAMTGDGRALGTGLADSRDVARTIATAEMLERRLVLDLINHQPDDSYLSTHPTTCGFAFGFSLRETLFRSRCEAIERWAWSHWIDRNTPLSRVPINIEALNPIARVMAAKFYDVWFLRSPPIHNIANGIQCTYRFCVTLGFHGEGVYAGSRVLLDGSEDWTHPLTESWRHSLVGTELKAIPSTENLDIIQRRILHFSTSRAEALGQLAIGTVSRWPSPTLTVPFIHFEPTTRGYLTRFLCHDYTPWHVGDCHRFVY